MNSIDTKLSKAISEGKLQVSFRIVQGSRNYYLGFNDNNNYSIDREGNSDTFMLVNDNQVVAYIGSHLALRLTKMLDDHMKKEMQTRLNKAIEELGL